MYEFAATAVKVAVLKESFKEPSIVKFESSLSGAHSSNKGSLKGIASGVQELSLPVSLVGVPVSAVLSSILPPVRAVALSLVAIKFSLIDVSILQFDLSFAVPISHIPKSLVYLASLVVGHVSNTVGHVAQQHAPKGPLSASGIPNDSIDDGEELFVFHGGLSRGPSEAGNRTGGICFENGFVSEPESFVNDASVGLKFHALAIRHAILPFSLVDSSICPVADPVSMVLAVQEISLIGSAFGKIILAPSMSLSQVKFTDVVRSIRPCVFPLSLSEVLDKVSRVSPPIPPLVASVALSLILDVVSLVDVPVAKGGAALAVPTPVQEASGILASVGIRHGAQPVGQAVEQIARVVSLAG